MSSSNIRVIKKAKESNHRFQSARYRSVYPHQEPFLVLPNAESPSPSPLQQPHRQSCTKRLCIGIFNFFAGLKKSEDEVPITAIPPSSAPYNVPSLASRISRSGSFGVEHNPYPRCSYIFDGNTGSGSGEDEIVVYIPRSKNSKRTVERFINSLNHNACIAVDRPYTTCAISNNVRQLDVRSKYSEIQMKSRVASSTDSKDSLERHSSFTQTRFHENAELGDMIGEAVRVKDLLEKIVKENLEKMGSMLNYFYIPVSTTASDKKCTAFTVEQKKIAWPSIHERHAQASRNREQIIMQRKDKWRLYFLIWTRRRLVGEKKKLLATDTQSLKITSPPNKLESRFHHIHWLGNTEKAYNSVGRYFDKEENHVVALKIFSEIPFTTIEENLDNKILAIQEINSLKEMDHKNIVKLLGYFELQDKYHLILESCDHSLREDLIEAPSGLGTSAAKKIIKYVLNGLQYCHHINCLHRDLCPENILVCKNGLVKIADFDHSVLLSIEGVGKASPTPEGFVYSSPEILAGDKEYGLPSDVWSLGIIFCELLTGQPPWSGTNAQHQLSEINDAIGPLLPRHASAAELELEGENGIPNHAQLQQMFTTISTPCCSFIKRCLNVNPKERFTCSELLQHQFIKGNYA